MPSIEGKVVMVKWEGTQQLVQLLVDYHGIEPGLYADGRFLLHFMHDGASVECEGSIADQLEVMISSHRIMQNDKLDQNAMPELIQWQATLKAALTMVEAAMAEIEHA